MTEDLRKQGEVLVRTRISGTRKGSDDPQYMHSIRVAQMLERHGYGEEVILAGLLHDIIEDSETTFDELRGMGYSERVLTMVDLCTHREQIQGGDARWVEMIARLVLARDPDAWAVKAADLADNVKDAGTMPPERMRFMREIKGPMMLSVSRNIIGETPIWHELEGIIAQYRPA